MNLRLLTCIVIGCSLLIMGLDPAKGLVSGPIELSPDESGVIKGPVSASASLISDKSGLYQVFIWSFYNNEHGHASATLYVFDHASNDQFPRRLLTARGFSRFSAWRAA